MKKPQKLDRWGFYDRKYVPDGYDMTEVPTATDDNFAQPLEYYNELVDVVLTLAENAGIQPEEEQ